MLGQFDEHRRWWQDLHAGDSAYISALGLFKALRNYVDPVLKGQPPSTVALGDMLFYLFSVHHSNGWELDPADWKAVGSASPQDLAQTFVYLCDSPDDRSSLRAAIRTVLAACRPIPPENLLPMEKIR